MGPRPRLWLATITQTIALAAAVGCQPSRPSVEARRGSRGVALIVAGDTAGWIVPCGCAANQSGGLPRRGTYVRNVRRDRAVILADAGGAPGGTSRYDRAKFEAILDGEHAMGVAAHNLGGPEAALGAEYLREVARRMAIPFLSANLRDGSGALVAEPLRIIEAGGMRVALVGVLSPRFARDGLRLRIDEPRDAILNASKAGKFDALIVLAYLPEAELRALAAELPEADAVIGGPTGQSIAPTKVGPTWLAAATNKGKYLVALEAADRSWTGRVDELGPDIADDPDQRRNLDRFRAELARLDLPADQTGFLTPLPPDLPDGYQVAGTDSCRACHTADCHAWDESHHAHAWRTLEARGEHVDPDCQRCHTTGYGLPGGFRSARGSLDGTAVGCESCHGPARAHVLRTTEPTPYAARDQCLRCHDPENSPNFAYDTYWARIRHGRSKLSDPTPSSEARP